MAHLVEEMVHVGQLPWHGISTEIKADLTVDEVLKAANLDWTVEKAPLYCTNKYIEIPNKFGLVRSSDNKILDIVGKDYKPTQNKLAFEFFEEFVKAGDMHLETAGSLDGGKMIWGLAKLHEEFSIKKDKIKSYLLLTNPHVYGVSINAALVNVRVVCNNTLQRALKEIGKNENVFKMTHSREFSSEIQKEAKETIGIAKEKIIEFKANMTTLTKTKVDEEQAKYYIMRLLSPESMVEEGEEEKSLNRNGTKVLNYFLEGNTPGGDLETAEGTAWGLFNATTYFLTHEPGKSGEKRLMKDFYGYNGLLKRKALSLALDMAKTA